MYNRLKCSESVYRKPQHLRTIISSLGGCPTFTLSPKVEEIIFGVGRREQRGRFRFRLLNIAALPDQKPVKGPSKSGTISLSE